jgi:NAD(P)-dependent dehydrogenase (short-subunit alcohol dehydrogenase family)
MQQSLADKRALVTGGTRGIGRSIAEALLNAGCRVAICGKTGASTGSAVAEMSALYPSKVFGIPADVSRIEDVSNLFRFVDSQMEGLEILVNNAGIGIFRSAEELTVEEWRRTIDVNLNGAFYCSKEAIPRMKRAGWGFIVNVSSLAGKNPFAGGAAYNASKFGMNGFSEAMMLDHRYDGIRVSYIMPGSVDTGFSPGSERANWKIAPEDVAEMVLAVLRMPERTLVSRVEVRPSKPKK